MRKSRYYPYLGLLFGIAIAIKLFASNDLRENRNVYEDPPSAEKRAASKIRFEEVSKKMGLQFVHRYNYPILGYDVPKNLQVLATMFPAISVADVDGDGFMDIYISAGELHVKNKFFHNEHGEHFTEMAEQMGIADINKAHASSFSVFADFNNDGILDLLVAKWGCHRLFYGEGKKANWHFKDATDKLGGYCSFPNGIGVADMNKDGRLDIVFGNFRPDFDKQIQGLGRWVNGIRGDKIHGGPDHVLFQKPDGSFDVAGKYTFKYGSFTHAVGLTDLNLDGYPDIFFANDVGTDEIYVNKHGKSFKEFTRKSLPLPFHQHSSMNSEIFDYNQDGYPDIFVSEGYAPPFTRKHNVLWERIPDTMEFKEVSFERGVGKCGFAWGAKFADFDLDGQPDLFVVNGRVTSEEVSEPADGFSYWYQRVLAAHVPVFWKGQFDMALYHGLSNRMYMSSWERSCMFRQTKDGFDDVTEGSGIDDLYNGRGLALIDYDNDGRVDLAVVNVGGPVLLYHNVTPRQGDWMGFDLDGGLGHRLPIGSRLELFRGAKTPLIRELFPTNGMKAQSDPRFVIGLGSDKISKASVVWPDGVREDFTDLETNSYNRLVRGKGELRVTQED